MRSSWATIAVWMMCGTAFAQTNGLTNFHKVNDKVYRGAQPTDEGFQNLAKMGVRTIIDLRGPEHSMPYEKKVVEAAGMNYVSIPMRGMAEPTDGQILNALKVLNDPDAGPVFVHCRRGADRTGAVLAVYRIDHDGWTAPKALRESKADGMSLFEVSLRRYVVRYAAIRERAGQAATASSGQR